MNTKAHWLMQGAGVKTLEPFCPGPRPPQRIPQNSPTIFLESSQRNHRLTGMHDADTTSHGAPSRRDRSRHSRNRSSAVGQLGDVVLPGLCLPPVPARLHLSDSQKEKNDGRCGRPERRKHEAFVGRHSATTSKIRCVRTMTGYGNGTGGPVYAIEPRSRHSSEVFPFRRSAKRRHGNLCRAPLDSPAAADDSDAMLELKP
jgi:hypothetical protein